MGSLYCDAIIFDMDGVLVDSEVLNEKHWKLWADLKDISLRDIMAIHHGIPAIQTIGRVAPHLNAAAEAQWFEKNLSEDMDGLRPFEGVESLLHSLPEGKWAIGTSAPKIIAFNRLKYLKLPVPPVVVTIDDVAQGKPAPDPYLKAAHGLGKRPERCLVIEDAPAGIKAARAAGARVLAIPTTNSEAALQEADGIIARFSDLQVRVDKEGLMVHWQP